MQQGYIALIDFQLYPPWASGLYNACAVYPAPGAPGIPFFFAIWMRHWRACANRCPLCENSVAVGCGAIL